MKQNIAKLNYTMNMLLKIRSNQREFLDNTCIPPNDLFLNLRELNFINKYLGGYATTIKGFNEILSTHAKVNTILDIGFGGGDSIKQISNYANKLKLKLFFYGVDINADCLKYAQSNLKNTKYKELICSDYRTINSTLLKKIDLIHCSLFLHHLSDNEILDLFRFCKENKCIVLVNDLHRHWLSYYSIKLLTWLFSNSYLVKNDAPLSVKKGFKKAELIALLKRAEYKIYSIKWEWAFRYRLIAYP